MKVEDRLLGIGKIWKDKKEKRAHDYPAGEGGGHPVTLSSFRS